MARLHKIMDVQLKTEKAYTYLKQTWDNSVSLDLSVFFEKFLTLSKEDSEDADFSSFVKKYTAL